MEIIDLDKLQLFFLFSVPGMIALYIRAQFLDGKVPSLTDGIGVYVALSLIYHALWFTISPAIYDVELASATGCEKLGWVGVLFLGPAILGVLSGVNIRKQWLRQFLEKFGMSTVHPVASAWDWKFSHISESWALITLKDGTKWSGVLGANSFISSSTQERDIFLEKVYEVDDNDQWHERTSGVLITNDQVQTIEIWPKGA